MDRTVDRIWVLSEAARARSRTSELCCRGWHASDRRQTRRQRRELAIAWVLRQPAVTATIAGSSRPGHIRDNAQSAAINLDPVIEELEMLIALGPAFNE